MCIKGFRTRAFVSVLTFISFIVLLLTGVELFMAPHDHTADWLAWSIVGIDQDIFSELHIIFGLLFLASSFVHILYNLKPLISYLKRPVKSGGIFNEVIVASVLSLVITIGTLAGIPGPANVIELGERLQNSWAVGYPKAPIPNTESLTIKQLSLLLQIEATALINRLEAIGITGIDTQAVIEDISEQHDIAPYKIYTAIKEVN